jgi:hypothetical protein
MRQLRSLPIWRVATAQPAGHDALYLFTPLVVVVMSREHRVAGHRSRKAERTKHAHAGLPDSIPGHEIYRVPYVVRSCAGTDNGFSSRA